MPGIVNIGGKNFALSKATIGGKKYEVLKAKKLLLDLIKYKTPPNEPDLKIIVLVGPPASGKTVLIRYLVYLGRENPDFEGKISAVRTNDIRIVKDPRYRKYFEGFKVVILIIDDLIGVAGFESRRAMSQANVDITKELMIIRHTFEENYEPDCIIFTIFASQILTRIDPTIRDNAQLTIFTAYYNKQWFHKLFPPEDAEVLRVATYEGMVSSNFDARRFALAKVMTNEIVSLEVPMSDPDDVPYDYVDRTVELDKTINRLATYLYNHIDFLDEFSKGELKEELRPEVKKIQEEYIINIRERDLLSAINRARLWKKKEHLKAVGIKPEIKILDKNGKFNITCPRCGNKQEYEPMDIGIIFKNPRTDCKLCGKKFYINKKELFTSNDLEVIEKGSQFNEVTA